MLALRENDPKMDPSMPFKFSISQHNHAKGSKYVLEGFKIGMRITQKMPTVTWRKAHKRAEIHYQEAKTP